MSEALKKLRVLTENLPVVPFANLVGGKSKTITEYAGEDGTFIGFGLFKTSEVAVQRVFMSKGTVIPKHRHPEKEWVLTYKGNYVLKLNGEEKECPVGTFVCFEPNVQHSGVMLEDTWIISITLPGADTYPDA